MPSGCSQRKICVILCDAPSLFTCFKWLESGCSLLIFKFFFVGFMDKIGICCIFQMETNSFYLPGNIEKMKTIMLYLWMKRICQRTLGTTLERYHVSF